MESTPLRILLVGADEDNYILVRDFLAQSGTSKVHLEWKSSYAAGLRTLLEDRYDVCLLDDRLGEKPGLDLLKEVTAKGCRCPIIFLAGPESQDGDGEAVRAGAADVLLRGQMNAPLLEHSILYILERRRTEETRRLLAAAIDQGTDGVAITDPHLTVQQVNPALEKISGYSKEEIVGRDLSTLMYPGREKASPTLWGPALAAHGFWEGRSSINRKDGHIARVKSSIWPVKGPSGRITHYVVHCRDLSGEFTIVEQIRRSQKSEALGTLARGIAHAFNNLLSTIVINTEMTLLELAKIGTVHTPLSHALQAANLGRELVRQMIHFSRQTEQEPKPMRVSPVLKEALKFLRSSLPNEIEIREEIDAQPDVILADPSQIHLILINLANNAAQAMREEGGVLEVKLNALTIDSAMAASHPDLEPGPYLRLMVRDTGRGMPPAVRERIFDPFFTAQETGEGMGLGLSVVERIVKSCGGTIAVYSEVGQGSTFHLFFPRLEGEPKEEKNSPWALAPEKKRILLIEDEELQLLSYQYMLEWMGYRVTALASSQDALSAFEADPHGFDLVITDQTMPKMTGLKLVEAFLEIRPDMPIILCTGFSETANAEEAKLKGVREFLMKPFSIGEIAEAIRRALQAPKAPGAK